jgi:hypothetical protein
VPFLGHQYHVAHADARSGALLVHCFDDSPAGGFCRGFLQGGFEALVAIPVMAEKAGLSEADLRAYEPSAEGFAYAAFVDAFAALPSFDDEALPVIQAGLDRGENPELIARVARLIQSYEKMFWDAMAAEAGLG